MNNLRREVSEIVQRWGKEWTLWFEQHIRTVEVQDDVTIAAVALRDDGYHLLFGPCWIDRSSFELVAKAMGKPFEEARELVVRHEFAHVIRGDALITRKRGWHPVVANVAQDIQIDEQLGIRGDDFCDARLLADGGPDWRAPVAELYEWLLKRLPPEDISGLGSKFLSDDIHYEAQNDAAANDHAAAASLDGRRLFNRGMGPLVLREIKTPLPWVPDAWELAWEWARAMAVDRAGWVRRRTRSWSGADIIDCPLVRGRSRRPVGRIAAVCDVSGSMFEWEQRVLGWAAMAADEVELVPWIHADAVSDWRPGMDTSYVGGGTEFAPVIRRAMREVVDVIIWCTDGMLADSRDYQSARSQWHGVVAWLLVPPHEETAVTGVDRSWNVK